MRPGGPATGAQVIEELGDGVTVVGTAHIASRSVQDVERTILEKRPSKVLVELDARRLEALQDPEAWKQTDILQVIKQGKQHLFLLQLYLASMQARMGRETGVAPGTEMLRAIQMAQEVGAEVVLIDRDVGLTLKRGFSAMGFWQKASLGMNVLMEASPGQPVDDEGEAQRSSPVPLVFLALLAGLAWFVPWFGERVAGASTRVWDALVGVPSLPALTVALTGFVAALAWAGAWPAFQRRKGGHGIQYGPLTVSAAVLGTLLPWFYLFADGLDPSFLGGLAPGGTGPVVGGTVALLLGAGGALLGARLARRIARFRRSRAEVMQHRETDIEAMLRSDAITAMTEEFAAFAPQIKTALIDERDAYMASHILEARGSGPVVAVVGAGHLPGIKRQVLAGQADARREALDRLPPKRLTVGKVLAYAFPAVILGVFGYLAFSGQMVELRESILVWVLYNGTLAALGALLARGHILSILTAFAAAPLTSLNPLLAAGWFAGAVEAKVHTPTVADFEEVRNVETMKEFYRNPVVRILLVTALANLGSAAGTYVAAWQIFENLGVL